MKRPTAAKFASLRCAAALVCALFFGLLSGGCKPSSSHTSNPQLRQIDELVNQQLPPGSPMSQVNFFLSSRGYPMEAAKDTHSMVAVIEHVDTETLQPSAARVTFHFDANDKLLTYELTAATPGPVQR